MGSFIRVNTGMVTPRIASDAGPLSWPLLSGRMATEDRINEPIWRNEDGSYIPFSS